MIPELGHYALVLALGLGLIQAIVPLIGAYRRDDALMRLAKSTALMQFAFVALSFAALTECYVTSDFSVANVFENSHSMMPLLYKFTSVWGNHEGSMLLWVLILSLFGASVAAFGSNLPATLKANVLAVQSWIACSFYLFILLTSNPFRRLAQAPFEGRDLNPILQDIGLAVHPPLLYLGYVGFSIAFSFAIAALIEGRIDAAWARWVRPWTLAAWMFLTVGIAMGSYWAYYELGWGGFWFWDPVENASLMPWLAGTALLHSAVVMEKRNALKIWTLLLAILAFSLSLIGTFLVRSGVLTSVHTFASDPRRGIFILGILVMFIGGGLTLFAWRAPMLKQGGLFAPVSREGALVFNNLFLTTACLTVFVGTLYPLALEALTGEKISVGAPFFNLTFAPLFIPLAVGDAVRAAAGVETRRHPGRGATADGGLRHRACRNRADLCGDGRGLDSGAVRSWPGLLCGAGVVHRAGRAHRFVPDAAGEGRVARGRPAAFGLGHGDRAFRHGVDAARHCFGQHLGQRAHCRGQATPSRVAGRLRFDIRRHGRSSPARTSAPRRRNSRSVAAAP